MIIIGLTGDIGAGKSETAKILAAKGAAIINADEVTHSIYKPGTSGYQQVVSFFGQGIVGKDGKIDRKALGEIVFNDKNLLKSLEDITHPLIKKEIEKRIDEMQEELQEAVIIEATLLKELNLKGIDEVWKVQSSEKIRKQRLIERGGLTPDEIQARFAAQEEKGVQPAFIIIENIGNLKDLHGNVNKAWDELKSRKPINL